MDVHEWVIRCSARLHARWPRIDREQRDEVAAELWGDPRWQAMEPERAAVEWLRQGMRAEELTFIARDRPKAEVDRDVSSRA
jgi:hypothetical protein